MNILKYTLIIALKEIFAFFFHKLAQFPDVCDVLCSKSQRKTVQQLFSSPPCISTYSDLPILQLGLNHSTHSTPALSSEKYAPFEFGSAQ